MDITRRQVLTGTALAAAMGATAGFGRGFSALANVTIGPRYREVDGNALVVMFLRGGADGLNIVAPYGDDEYYKLRPTLGLAAPGDRRSGVKARAIRLDDRFALHPALAPLAPLHAEGRLAAVHAIGSWDDSRSHFEAMEAMERGLARVSSGASSGWLARHLATTARDGDSPLRAVSISETMPDSLRGATTATALRELAQFRLLDPFAAPTGADGKQHHSPAGTATGEGFSAMEETLREMYSGDGRHSAAGGDSLLAGGHAALAAMEAVRRLDPANYRPSSGANYPRGEIGDAFRQVACLVKGEVGLEVACLEMGGWDTHVAQGADIGWQALRLTELGQALAAFDADLGRHTKTVTTVVMTEFGRRAYENTGLGTDHGRAGAWLLMGESVVGGPVHTEWPGLKKDQLDDNGDLRVTTDYRDVLAEILLKRLKNDRLSEVFPNYTPRVRNIVRSA